MRVWRSGALFGKTPEEAFYVKCDSETNPRYLIDAGQVNVQVGICPVQPAEFVIFSIGQWDGGGLIEEVGRSELGSRAASRGCAGSQKPLPDSGRSLFVF